MSNLNLSFGELLGKLISALPQILIGFLLLVNMGVGALLIRPPLQEHRQLSDLQKARQTSLATARSEHHSQSDTLQIQVDSMQTRLDEGGDKFLSPAEADSILNRIYGYASSSKVEITNLQLQPLEEQAASDLYMTHVFKLQIEGTFAQLVVFLSLFREASVPGVSLNNLSVTVIDGERKLLTVDMLLYTSPYAAGEVLTGLPPATLPAPMPTPMPTATVLPPTPTVTPLAIETAVVQPTATFSSTVLGPGTYDDSSPALLYLGGVWESMPSERGFSGTYHYSSDTAAEVQFSFIGSSVGVQYVAYRNFGIFEIYVDGKLWGEVDGYAPEGTFGQVTYISGLDYSVHSVGLHNTTRRNSSSEGNVLALDAFYVLRETQSVP